MKLFLPFATTLSFLYATSASEEVERRVQVGSVQELKSAWFVPYPTKPRFDYDEATGEFNVEFDGHGTSGRDTIEIWTLPGGQDLTTTGNERNACRTRKGVLAGYVPYGTQGTDWSTDGAASAVSWLKEQSFITTDPDPNSPNDDVSTLKFKLDDSVRSEGINIFKERAAGVTDGEDTVLLCVLFGKTDDAQPQDDGNGNAVPIDEKNPPTFGNLVTFVELALEIKFIYDGNFEVTDFATKPLNPRLDEIADAIGINAYLCGDNGDDITPLPGQTVIYNQRQVISVCLCPDEGNQADESGGPELATVAPSAGRFAMQSVEYFSVGDGNLNFFQTLITPDALPAQTSTVQSRCNHDADTGLDSDDNDMSEVPAYCCRVDFLLNEYFFPQYEGEAPAPAPGADIEGRTLNLRADGSAYIQFGSEYGENIEAGDPDTTDTSLAPIEQAPATSPPGRRVLRTNIDIAIPMKRGLQEDVSEGEAGFETEIDIVAVATPPEGVSAATGNKIASFFAVVAAVGAAFAI